MITKNAVIDQIKQFSKDYQTEVALFRVEEDLKLARKILAIFIYNRLDGTKEISLVTEPELHIKYKFNKR